MKALAAAAAAAALTLAGTGEPAPVALVEVAAGGERATGFVVGPGRVMTVAHVLDGQRSITVGGAPAEAIAVDAAADLALLRAGDELARRRGRTGPELARRRGRAEPLAGGGRDCLLVLRGDRAACLPAPVRRRITATMDGHRRAALELAARVRRGDSGAPVLDARGRVIGVVFARSDARPGVAYASRLTVSGENAGRQIATYSAPSGSGVE